jgi:hypothetical protein
MPYAGKLMMQELMAMGVAPKNNKATTCIQNDSLLITYFKKTQYKYVIVINNEICFIIFDHFGYRGGC